MYIKFEQSPEMGPINATRILNKAVCYVASVGVSFTGKLCYRECWHLFTRNDIDHVVFLQSNYRKNLRLARTVEAYFNIYTRDGRVIEVCSCDRSTIVAALKESCKK